jgi:autotransporter-associated beta strand protein
LTIDSQFSSGGIVVFNNPTAVSDPSTASDYSGTTHVRTLNAATGAPSPTGSFVRLRAGAANAFSPNSDLIVDQNSFVELGGFSNTIAGLSGAGTVDGVGAVLTVQGGVNNSFSGSLQNGTGGTLSLRKSGSGTQILTTANSYTGGTTIEDGVLQVENSGALGNGEVVITGSGSGTLGLATSWSTPLTLEGRSSASTDAHVNNVSGTNTLSGALTLKEEENGDDPANFTIDSTAGALTVTSDLAFSETEGATVNLGGASTGANLVSGDITLSGDGTDALDKEGAGSWTVSGAVDTDEINVNDGKLVLSGVASTGAVNVNGGDLNVANTLSTTGNVDVSGGATLSQIGGSFIDRDQQDGGYIVDGTVNMNGQAASMNWLEGEGLVTNAAPVDPTLTLGYGGTARTWSGVIADGNAAIDVVKDGTNTQTFDDANTYTGGTTIQGGILELTGDGAVGDGTVTVESGGGTFALNDLTPLPSGERTNAITLEGRTGPTAPAHIVSTSGANSLSGPVTLDGTTGAEFNIDSTGTEAGDKLTVGAITGSGDDENLNLGGGGDGQTGAIALGAGTDTLNVVDGSTWTLGGAASGIEAATVGDGGTLGNNGGSAFAVDSMTLGANATYDMGGNAASLGALDGAADSVITSGALTDPLLTLGGDGANGNMQGVIEDGGGEAVAVTKVGSNTQTLSGTNTYTGNTRVTEDGVLELSGDGTAGSTSSPGSLFVEDAATLALTDLNSTMTNAVTLQGRAGTESHIDSTSGDNVMSGPITLDAATDSEFNIESTGTEAGDKLTVGAITGSGVSENLNLGGGGGGQTGAIALGAGTDTLNVVDGSTWTLGGVASGIEAVTIGADGFLGNDGGAKFSTASTTLAANATYDMGGNDADLGQLTTAADSLITSTALVDPTLTFGSNGGPSTTMAGIISGDEVNIEKVGSNTVTLSGDNAYKGTSEVTAGALNLQNATALGTTDGNTTVSGTGRVVLQGGISVAEAFDLIGRADMGVHLENVSDDNAITGAVVLVDSNASATTDDIYTITSEGGVLSIDTVTGAGGALDTQTLVLGGASTGANMIGSLDMTASATNNLTKTGVGTWEVQDATMSNGTISSQDGVLKLSGSASLTGDMVYEVLQAAGQFAELDATGIGGLNLDLGDQLQGGGLVTANVIAEDGAIISVGDSSAAGQDLEVSGDLELAGTLALNVNGSMIDLLLVGGDLNLIDATLDLVGSLSSSVYVLAQYLGDLSGTFMTTVAGYSFDYGYGAADNQIALVRDSSAVPTPAPLALIGLGALAWGASRRGKKAAR